MNQPGFVTPDPTTTASRSGRRMVSAIARLPKGNAVLRHRKSAVATLFAGMLAAATSVGPQASAIAPTTLGNSAPNLSIFKAQQGGLYVGGALFNVGLPQTTTLQTSTTPWVSNNTIQISQVPFVSGTVYSPNIVSGGQVFSITTPGDGLRHFLGNGLPPNTTPMGIFGPVQPGTPAYPYYSAAPGGVNYTPGTPGFGQTYPNAGAIGISPYNLDIKVAAAPTYLSTPQPIKYLILGITYTGIPWHAEIANASATAWYNPISILPLDSCFGHPYSQQYHYHAYSWRCLPNQQAASGPSPLAGWALDGFGIYGPRGADGRLITNAQLDVCHGTTSPVPVPVANDPAVTVTQNVYHYVLNSEYPYSIGCFRGAINPANVAGTPLPLLGQSVYMPGMSH